MHQAVGWVKTVSKCIHVYMYTYSLTDRTRKDGIERTERKEAKNQKDKRPRKEGHRNRNIRVRAVTGEIRTHKRDTRWFGKRGEQKDRRYMRREEERRESDN
jgi:hypothetical protein